MSNKNDYGFLEDKPLSTKDIRKDQFGYNFFAKKLAEIVSKANTPFAIGLFGGWGIGKSSLLEIAKIYLAKLDIFSVTFDVWKYDRDSLRRQFLINLDNKAELGLNLSEELTQSLTTHQGKSVEELKFIPSHYFIYLLTGFTLTVVLILLKPLYDQFIPFTLPDEWILANSIETLSALVVPFLVALIPLSMRYKATSIHKNKEDTADGFEKHFNRCLSKFEKLNKNKRLFIIIDNLDRTSHKVAFEFLTDIKTFLATDEKNNVVFAIACDEKAIKRHISNSGYDHPEEFINKFLDLTIKLPSIIPDERYKFIRTKLRDTKVKEFMNDYDLEWIIDIAYRRSPRRIIQFINNLTARFELARSAEQKELKLPEEERITRNPTAFAKLLVIQDKCPDIYSHFEDIATNGYLTWDAVQDEVNNYVKSIDPQDKEKKKLIDSQKALFDRFMEQTPGIDIPRLDEYMKLRQSQQEKKVPGISSLIAYAEEYDLESAKKTYAEIKFGYKDANDILRTRVHKVRNETQRFISLISILILVLESDLKHFNRFLLNVVKYFPRDKDLAENLTKLQPLKVHSILFSSISEKQKKDIVGSYLTLFNSDDHDLVQDIEMKEDLIQMLIKFSEYYLPHSDTISTALSKQYLDREYLITLARQKRLEYISEDVVFAYIQNIPNEILDDFSDFKSRFALFTLVNISNETEIFHKLAEILTHHSKTPYDSPSFTSIATIIYDVLTSNDFIQVKEEDSILTPHLKTLIETVLRWSKQESDPNENVIYILTLFELQKVSPGSINTLSLPHLRDYFKSEITAEIFDKIVPDKKQELVDFFKDEISERLQSKPELISTFQEYLSSTDVEDILIKIYSQRKNEHELVLNVLRSNYEFVNDKARVVEPILTDLPNFEPVPAESYLTFIANENKGDRILREKVFNIVAGKIKERPGLLGFLQDYFTKKQRNELKKIIEPNDE